MPRRSTIQTYIIVLLFQTLLGSLFILPIFGYRTNCRWYPEFYIVRMEDGIHIYSNPEDEDLINACLDDSGFIEMRGMMLYPQYKIGPLKGILEFYKRESFLSSPDEYRWKLAELNLTQTELYFVHQELIHFAKNNRQLSQFQPGAPARIEFLPGATLFSLTMVGTYLGLPALITWLIGYFKAHTHQAIASRRRDAGLCIHCAYDCTNLPSPTCPECGQLYAVILVKNEPRP